VQPDSRPTPPPASWVTFLGAFALGVVVGAVGTVMHRWMRPWGVVVVLVLVLASAVAARAWGGRRAWTGYAVALTATIWLLSTEGPGGDVLVPSGQRIGWVWLIGAPVVAVVVAVLPASLFDDRPRPVRGRAWGAVAGPPAGAAPAPGWPTQTGAGEPGWPAQGAGGEPGPSPQPTTNEPGWPPAHPAGPAAPNPGASGGGPGA